MMSSEKSKILFIINAMLEKRLRVTVGDLIGETLDPALYDPSIVYTECPGQAQELARESMNHYQVIVAGGGDGTVNEIASQLIHSEVILGILPMGSGKGLARSLGIPMDLRGAIRTLNDFNVIEMDTGLANQFRFINIAGIGFDAAVAHAYAGKSGRGFFTYARQTARLLFRYASLPVRIKTSPEDKFTRVFLLCFANSSQWGYGARISPHASLTDGLLDLCTWHNFPRVLSPLLLIRLFSGSIHRSGFIDITTFKTVEIVSTGNLIGHIDGEPVEFSTPLSVSIDPGSLKVITGRQAVAKP
jgi:diacylglycerol kinase family enzyme